MAKNEEDPQIAAAFSSDGKVDLEAAIAQLDPDEAQFFLKKLEAAFRKRKIMLSGYIVAMVAWLVGMVCALAYFGMASGFTGWVFLVPFLIVGVILWVFGNLAERAGRSVPEPTVAAASESATPVPDPKP